MCAPSKWYNVMEHSLDLYNCGQLWSQAKKKIACGIISIAVEIIGCYTNKCRSS